jgi:hypothetical protein
VEKLSGEECGERKTIVRLQRHGFLIVGLLGEAFIFDL